MSLIKKTENSEKVAPVEAAAGPTRVVVRPMDTTEIAEVCHEVNRAYCLALGDTSQVAWAEAPVWQRNSAVKGVEFHLDNPDATPENSHESWLALKTEEGWKYGEVKDAEKKEHPCFRPYSELPETQRAKDYIFRATVHALARFVKA